MNEQTLISKVWNYAHVLRDEGVSYGDYVGQISFLLFLKMDEERTKYLNEPSLIPKKWQWDTLRNKSGEALDEHYKEALVALSKTVRTSISKALSRQPGGTKISTSVFKPPVLTGRLTNCARPTVP